ncbi:hypothetical protein K431DRAFT_220096 [Polychaeton citri CBS 116435]|uniref:Calcineurin-like phosphoesterase domain-containing protein n=1 Tax=Polychaeton citri CBS 116435 TaxID=1314669 RepID=A0A9P4Q9T2_9PEZI|nr:hypothetical protein K431DRAFT_220096 [Polychaeton citri CBS 116435]
MHLRHAASHYYSHALRRYPTLRHASATNLLILLFWIYILQWGERNVSRNHIDSCSWESWEQWPRDATPHHLVFIADPQLIDPHTYPDRPWPLSVLTERYTDQYMRRNFHLINQDLDPDSIVFLGDLFDGGREWAAGKARPLKSSQKQHLEQLGVLKPEAEKEQSPKQAQKRDPAGVDLKEFVHGENGRWATWGQPQWDQDYDRFARIFYEHDQLYPDRKRDMIEAYEVETDPLLVDNGAPKVTRREYATIGKERRLYVSLPGNHDLGFGAGVQWAVRDRYESRFGDANTVNVIGNHTFVSIDALSLSAMSEFDRKTGYEIGAEQANKIQYLWKPAMNWLNELNETVATAVTEAMNAYYPDGRKPPWKHQIVPPMDTKHRNLAKAFEGPAIPKTGVELPVVLLSHVPLYREPNTNCGKMRERGNAISISAGYQYQNVLTRSLSETIVRKVSAAGDIVGVFSGDDHDYCEVAHRYNVRNDVKKVQSTVTKSIKEITVKSFSWAMGVREPGFLLASLWNPVDAKGNTIGTPLPTIQTHLCLLPDQLGVFINYGLAAAATFLVLLIRAVILALRPVSESDDEPPNPFKIPLSSWRSANDTNGAANGYATSERSDVKGRNRASSSSLFHSSQTQNGHLGVQRSYTARTRSVSPAAGGYSVPYQPPSGALIEKAGYFPEVRWNDPDDSDEESHIGEESEDSQAKWKRRRRTGGKARTALEEFFSSVIVVGLPACLYYIILVRSW